MTLRIPAIITTFISAITIGPGANLDSTKASDARIATSENSSRINSITSAPIDPNSLPAPVKNYIELHRGLTSGQRSAEEIQTELTQITSDNPIVRWDPKHIRGNFELTQIITHVENFESQFQVMTWLTLPSPETQEHSVTYFTSKLNDADVQSLKGSFVFAQTIQSDKDKIVFENKKQFFYFASANSLLNGFHMREPSGEYQIGPLGVNSFDPISLLATESGVFEETGEYQYDISLAGAGYSITLIPRITDIHTLTLEVIVRPEGGSIAHTFVLVYEGVDT